MNHNGLWLGQTDQGEHIFCSKWHLGWGKKIFLSLGSLHMLEWSFWQFYLFYGIEVMTIISYLYRTLQFTKTHLKPFLLLTTVFRRYQCSGHSFQFADKERGLRDGRRFGAGDRGSGGRVSLRRAQRDRWLPGAEWSLWMESVRWQGDAEWF